MAKNHCVALSSRPGSNGTPSCDNFRFEECDSPTLPDENGFVIVKLQYLSVDPYMRCRMNESTGVDYIGPWQIGKVITGSGIGLVLESNSEKFSKGDFVINFEFAFPWQTIACIKDELLSLVNPLITEDKHSLMLGVFGVTGLTSYIALQEKANIIKHQNQTMVVSGAAGGCGTVACQLAKINGCKKVVGIAGTKEKCTFLKSELGVDEVVCYRSDNVEKKLAELCSDGIDVYFDNVGGEISNSVINHMKQGGRVILVGQIAVYNKDLPYPPPIPLEIENVLKEKSIKRERFLVVNYKDKFEESVSSLFDLVRSGTLKAPENIIHGLENAGKAFISMMEGGNIGKQIVKL